MPSAVTLFFLWQLRKLVAGMKLEQIAQKLGKGVVSDGYGKALADACVRKVGKRRDGVAFVHFEGQKG